MLHQLPANDIYDNTLRIWNLITYQCITTIYNISCNDCNSLFQIHEEKLIVGGENGIVTVNFITGMVEKEIWNENVENIVSFEKVNNNEVLCGSENGSIQIYNIIINSITHKVKLHNNVVSGIIRINETMFSTSSWDHNIIIWKYE